MTATFIQSSQVFGTFSKANHPIPRLHNGSSHSWSLSRSVIAVWSAAIPIRPGFLQRLPGQFFIHHSFILMACRICPLRLLLYRTLVFYPQSHYNPLHTHYHAIYFLFYLRPMPGCRGSQTLYRTCRNGNVGHMANFSSKLHGSNSTRSRGLRSAPTKPV